LLNKIQAQLFHRPAEETKQRKKLRPNPFASWELRVREFRVFFDIDEQEQTVFIIAIGRKKHNTLLIDDREFEL
jgi:mRNA interferase RelE/StbE